MAQSIFESLPIRYQGLFADDHFVDAQQFGKSLIGASRLAKSSCHFFLFGEVADNRTNYPVRFYVGPSKENGYLQELFAMMSSGLLPLFTPTVLKIAHEYIQKLIEAVVKILLGQKSDSSTQLLSEVLSSER